MRGFIRVTSSTWPSRGGPLVYVPAFHAVITSTEEGGQEVRVELVNFQGRPLPDHSEVVAVSGWSGSRVMDTLRLAHLCSGVHTTPLDAVTPEEDHKEMVEAMSKDMCLETMNQVRLAHRLECA